MMYPASVKSISFTAYSEFAAGVLTNSRVYVHVIKKVMCGQILMRCKTDGRNVLRICKDKNTK